MNTRNFQNVRAHTREEVGNAPIPILINFNSDFNLKIFSELKLKKINRIEIDFYTKQAIN
jgi:hypothetical protein